MASVEELQALSTRLAKLRKDAEDIFIPSIAEFIKEIDRASKETDPAVVKARQDDAFGQLSKNITSIREYLNERQQYSFIRTDPELAVLWENLNQGSDSFFTQESLIQPQNNSSLYSYLLSSSAQFSAQMEIAASEARRLIEETKAPETKQASSPKTEQETPTDFTKKRDEIRKKQQDAVRRAKQVYLEHQKRLVQIEALLPSGLRFGSTAYNELEQIALAASLTDASVEQMLSSSLSFSQFRSTNPPLFAILTNYTKALRLSRLAARRAEGGTMAVLSSQDNTTNEGLQTSILVLSKAYPLELNVIEKAISRSGSDLDAEAQKGDTDAIKARDLRIELIKGQIQRDKKTLVDAIKRSVGLQIPTSQDIVTEFSLSPASMDDTDIIASTSGSSLLDLLGTTIGEAIPLFDEGGEPADEVNPQAGITASRISPAKRNQRLQQFAKTAKFIASNPVLAGGLAVGGAGAGTVLFGILSQAPAISAAVGGTLGASAGALVGSFIAPGVGTFIGAAIGGVLGGSLGFVAAGGTSQGVASIGATLGSTAGPTIQAGLGTAAGYGGAALNTSIATTSNFISSLSSISPSLASLPAAIATVFGPIGGAILITSAVVIPSLLATYQTAGQPGGVAESKYLILSKIPSSAGSEDPTSITYEIKIQAKEGYSILIKEITDNTALASKGTPSPDPKSLYDPQPDLDKLEGQQVSGRQVIGTLYTVPYNESYDDTRITNNLTIKFEVTGNESLSGEFATKAIVNFGEPPSAGGCWPASGTLWQGPFDQGDPFTHYSVNKSGTRTMLDAVDIGGKLATAIYAPFDGSVAFYNQQTGIYDSGGYGNYAVLKTSDGKTLLFAHMVKFFEDFTSLGTSYPVTATQQIGYMGNSESPGKGPGGAGNYHLHYELKPSKTQPLSAPPPAVSNLEPLLPEAIQYSSLWRVSERQVVSSDICGPGGGGVGGAPTGEVRKEVGCFTFVDGNEKWGHTDSAIAVEKGADELTYYSTEITKMLSDSRIKNILCKGGPIIVERIKAQAADGGCGSGSGSSGAKVISANRIQVCDKLFNDKPNFGRNTIWHEPGHIIQDRRLPWKTYFKDQVAIGGNYLPSYATVLKGSYIEDFAESFGMCNKTRITGEPGYRSILNESYNVEPYKSRQCADIERMLNELGK